MKKIIAAIFGIIFLTNINHAQSYRYVKTIFPASDITYNVAYGTAPFLNAPYSAELLTANQNLIMDIYRPQGDTLTRRPAIIFAHGGGFAQGSRNVNDMTAFCDTFARKGYVAVTIDYRQGVEVVDNSNLHYTRAAYRGMQDGRGAVRFLRANAASYGIDTNMIYWGGNSAGSFIGLNNIYMDASEKPAYAGSVSYMIGMIPYTGPDLGGLDIGSNMNYSGKPNAVMACWGGVGDTLIIQPANDQHVFLIHGTADQIVPFNSGPPFNLLTVAAVYGSNSISKRLSHLGIPAQQTYFVPGVDHEFYGVTNGNWSNGTSGNTYWDTVVVKATDFFRNQHKPVADFTFLASLLNVNFTDISSGAVTWLWDFGDGDTSNAQNPGHIYASGGTYPVKLYIENSIQSWDTISYNVTVSSTTGIDHIRTSDFNIYPNPSNGLAHITFDIPLKEGYLMILNIYGQVMAEKAVPEGSQMDIDLNSLENGIYFIRINSDTKTTQVKYIKE